MYTNYWYMGFVSCKKNASGPKVFSRGVYLPFGVQPPGRRRTSMPHPQDRKPLPSDVLARIVAAAERGWARGDGTVIVQFSTKPDASKHASVKVLAPDKESP